MNNRTTLIVLTVISTAVLAYELTQIRIFAYSLHTVIAYSAIALAMLGFGLGATFLALKPGFGKRDYAGTLLWLTFALAGTIVAVNLLFARTSAQIILPGTMDVQPFWITVVLLPCIVPYFLAGMITTLIFQAGLSKMGRLYFWNLLGSAIGSAGMIAFLRPLGAERLVLVTAGLIAAAGFLIAFRRSGGERISTLLMTIAFFALTPFAKTLFPLEPDPNGYNALFERDEESQGFAPPVAEITEWDPIGRIDVLKYGRPHINVFEKIDYRVVTIDGGAMTLMLGDPGTPGWGKELFGESIYGLAYQLKEKPDVLVIGSGGGSDVDTALYWNAASVVGVEISYSTLKAVTGPYADFVGWPKRENVEVFHGDGRAFAKSTERHFDIVQMSGVDTMTNHTSGSAMVAAEDYLYTVEAFVDFLNILKPGGVLSVMRFGDEALNLSAIAVRALRHLGIAHPERCIAAMRQAHMSGIVVKKEGISRDDVEALSRFASRDHVNPVDIPIYDQAKVRLGALLQLLYPMPSAPAPRFQAFFQAVSEGREDEALKRLGDLFEPPTDDQPYYILGRFVRGMLRGSKAHPAVGLLLMSTLIIGLASLVLILLPAFSVRKASGSRPGTMAAVVCYFFAIGAGFMLLEVGLIHKAQVFVSTPGAAVAVVISAILVSSGIGARVSDLVGWTPKRSVITAVIGLLLISVIYRLGAGPLFDRLFGLPIPVRCGLAALTLSPAGFFMGWFFPVGLRIAGANSPTLVPWAIAVNGFASVIGSLATLFLGVMVGLTGVFVIALVCYLGGVLIYLPVIGRTPLENNSAKTNS